MGGLLYKDFVSINRIGKIRVTWVITIYLILFILLRIAFPGNKAIQDFIVTNEDGSVVNLLDSFFVFAYIVFIFVSMSFIVVSKIMNGDEKNKIGNYLDSMPLGKNTYVASKYVFIGISAYVALSLDYICGIACVAFCQNGMFQNTAATLNSFLFNFISLMLLLAAIEIPLYISIGKEKAMRVMVVFWSLIAFVVIGFLMFGDLTIFSNLDLKAFLNFMEKHKSEVLFVQSLEPAIVLGLYFVSFRISCRLYHRKEK